MTGVGEGAVLDHVLGKTDFGKPPRPPRRPWWKLWARAPRPQCPTCADTGMKPGRNYPNLVILPTPCPDCPAGKEAERAEVKAVERIAEMWIAIDEGRIDTVGKTHEAPNEPPEGAKLPPTNTGGTTAAAVEASITALDGSCDPMHWAIALGVVLETNDVNASDAGFMVGWFANAMEAARQDERSKILDSASMTADDGEVKYMTPRSGELWDRIVIESGRLEGMASMTKILGTGNDSTIIAHEMEAMAARLRGEPEPPDPRAPKVVAHTPDRATLADLGLDR